ncbi:MAG: hypothetical protein ACOYL6_16035 [Bacteriovoracaceae bacterium]
MSTTVANAACDSTLMAKADGVGVTFAEGTGGTGISFNIVGDYMQMSVTASSQNANESYLPLVRFSTSKGYEVCSFRAKTVYITNTLKSFTNRNFANTRSMIETCAVKIKNGSNGSFSVGARELSATKIFKIDQYNEATKTLFVSVDLNHADLGSIACN